MRTIRPTLLLAAALLSSTLIGCSATNPNSPPTHDADLTYQHDTLAYLASDSLEGRGVGTNGLNTAANFIAEQYRKAGLVPLPGRSDYFQPFSYTLGQKIEESKTSLVLGSVALKLDDEYRPNNLSGRNKSFDGEVVFAGYGIASKQYKYDDYEGLDLKGKIALILRYEPRDAANHSRFTNSEDWSAEASLARKFLAAQSHGASAILVVNPPNTPPEDALSPFTGQGRGLVIPIAQISRAAADRILAARSLPSLEQLASSIDSAGKPASRALDGLTASGEFTFIKNVAWIKNVIALLPGTGPHKDEYVVVGAHYDHLGYGGAGSLAPSLHAIHHGADDNGSGTTAVLTLARRYGLATEKPDRSIIFMSFSAEEEGLIGSNYFVSHPLVPLSSIAYMLNLDMVGRMKNSVLQHGGEGTADTLQPILDQAFAGSGFTPKSFGKGGIGPSDHASFAKKQIPVIFLFTGLHTDYHRPTDTADKINYPGLIGATDVADKILRALTTAPKVPYNTEADKFPQDVNRAEQYEKPPGAAGPRAAAPDNAPSATPEAPAQEQVGLGIVPDMAQSDHGMRIDAVRPNSPAAKAGLKAEDIILTLDGAPINSVQDLQDVYTKHKPGDEVELTYERAKAKTTTKVKFTRRGSPTN